MATKTRSTAKMPPAPRTIQETGLPWDLVLQLVVKQLHVSGGVMGTELASRLGVVFSVIEPCLDSLKREHHCDISGGSMGPPSYVYRLTDTGHARAEAFSDRNQYVGQLPVPVQQYRAYMKAFGEHAKVEVTRPAVRDAFSHLVLSDRVLDQLGPAVAARHSLFLYGPPGNGKTVMSQAVRNLFAGEIAVPYAVSVDTEVIRVFDPLNHDVAERRVQAASIELDASEDGRWVWCRRPAVIAGGELTMDALDLGYNATGRFYRAPLQVLANGGVLIVDDFGRQRVSPREMLNRWIVPLESRVDHLTLQSGQKFEVPFDVMVVFATNLNPLDLVDEAFLRRIRYKVYAESPTDGEFLQIFENYCVARGLRFDRRLAEALIANELRPRNVILRGCHPRDLIDHALSLAAYIDQPTELSADLLAAACATYFVADGAGSGQ
jgi:predicted ATPase with chaperone activity